MWSGDDIARDRWVTSTPGLDASTHAPDLPVAPWLGADVVSGSDMAGGLRRPILVHTGRDAAVAGDFGQATLQCRPELRRPAIPE